SDGRLLHSAESNGIPLGFMKNYVFSTHEPIQLKAGDIVVVLTDGVTEAIAPDESLFGLQKTIDFIARHRDKNAAEIVALLNQAAFEFSQQVKAEDDITSLVCKVGPA
ncbi:SpoIIE family protein phosphatase, partial [candidate division KSB1 bacterium]|nr:SpoIIE family protein phosphatase [candidate division KSB1 bacterium]